MVGDKLRWVWPGHVARQEPEAPPVGGQVGVASLATLLQAGDAATAALPGKDLLYPEARLLFRKLPSPGESVRSLRVKGTVMKNESRLKANTCWRIPQTAPEFWISRDPALAQRLSAGTLDHGPSIFLRPSYAIRMCVPS